ncbi:hypothetical protein Q7P37_010708 [Cladosporium fusiforme]
MKRTILSSLFDFTPTTSVESAGKGNVVRSVHVAIVSQICRPTASHLTGRSSKSNATEKVLGMTAIHDGKELPTMAVSPANVFCFRLHILAQTF